MACLDGLRGVLATYVMVSHMAPFADLPAWLQRLLSHGGAAVDMFFILSGMVIAVSLAQRDAWGFLAARARRTLPAYAVALAVAIAVQPLPLPFVEMPWIGPDNPGRHIWSQGWPPTWRWDLILHLTMTHGLVPDGVSPHAWVGFLGAAWSLSTEWQFYILALLLRRPSAWVFLALGAAGLIWQHWAPFDWQFSRAFLPNKAEYFALGLASAAWVRDIPKGSAVESPRGHEVHEGPRSSRSGFPSAWPGVAGWIRYPLRNSSCPSWSFVNFVSQTTALQQCPPRSRHNITANAPRIRDDASLRLLAVLLGVLALCIVRGGWEKTLAPLAWMLCLGAETSGALPWLSAALRHRSAQWFGGISYSLYLVNEPIQKLLGIGLAHLAHRDAWVFAALWLPLAFALPIAAAALCWRWIEQPFLRKPSQPRTSPL